MENAMRQEMEQIDWQAGKSLIVILPGPSVCACHCKKPQWRTWKITPLSAHQQRVHCMLCLVLQCLASITHQGETLEHCSATQVGSNFASHVSIWQHKCSRAFKIFAHTVSISLKKKQISHGMNGNMPIFRAWGPLKITSQEWKKKLFQGTLHMTVVFTETLISLKQDYDRPFYWSVIWSVCTQCWTTCWHVSLSFLRSSWRFDRWAALLCSLSASQEAQRDGKITPCKAN